MRIRRDVVFVSSVLFTVALLSLIPISRQYFFAGHSRWVHEELDPCCQRELYAWGHVGEASHALILIGLIVTWTGYARAVRSAWFVMFIVVWVWAFPLFFLGWIFEFRGIPFRKLISEALEGPGPARAALYAVAHFAPMLIALILPIRAFFRRRGLPETAVRS